MPKITLTIEGEDWADVGLQLVGLYEALNRQAAQALAVVPTPAPVVAAPVAVSGALVAIVEGPAGQCPKHLRPWKSGNRGQFCSAKDEAGFNGYCSLTPGDIWNGKRAAA